MGLAISEGKKMYDLKPIPEGETIYQCQVCGKQNLDKSSMVFQATSRTNNLQPFMCRACYAVRQETERQEYQQQKQHEQKQEDERKAHHQAIARRLHQEALGLPVADGEPSAEAAPPAT